MAIGALVGVMVGQALHGLGDIGEDAADAVLPRLFGVERGGVPTVVGHAKEANLRGLGLVHRVGDEAGVERPVLGGEPIGPPQEQVGTTAVVGHRPVPPDVSLTANLGVDPLHRGLGNIGADRVARPHNLDVGIQPSAEGFEVGAAAPSLVILRGAKNERGDIALCADKLAVDRVQELDLHLGAGTLATDVIEEDREGTHAQRVHPLELLHARLDVAVIAPLNVAPGVDGPDEVDLVLVRHAHELGDVLCLGCGVGVAPTSREAVIGVVLRPVDVGVHLPVAIEAELALARLKAPGLTVEALDRAAEGNRRPVLDRHRLRLARGKELLEGLGRIEEARAISRRDRHALRRQRQRVALLGLGGIHRPGNDKVRLGLKLEDFAQHPRGIRVQPRRRRNRRRLRLGHYRRRQGYFLRRWVNAHRLRQHIRQKQAGTQRHGRTKSLSHNKPFF